MLTTLNETSVHINFVYVHFQIQIKNRKLQRPPIASLLIFVRYVTAEVCHTLHNLTIRWNVLALTQIRTTGNAHPALHH